MTEDIGKPCMPQLCLISEAQRHTAQHRHYETLYLRK